jgi:SAM-dependent methyltransferase
MWDEKYSADHYIYGVEPNDFLKANFRALPQGNILCLAEGEGRNAVFLARNGYQVTAVDSSAVGLRKAGKLAEENKVAIDFICCDLHSYDIGEEQWDGIVSIFCHVPAKLRQELHRKIMKGLKKDGVLLLEAYTANQLKHGTGGPPTEDLMYSKAILRKELENMKFSHLVELEREIIEGTYHCGVGAVVQAIGSAQ